ncbi:hypothetical protein E2C01_088438 [Portunus trituberculatus]|uniref:Uncharacterized protein n=1 Tax=Portunus trituberculatus TaxID=210409 RepID=A0A5B7JLW7_PORTR|nr:hypothetical protein [Portunus trituberculatus]
MCRDGPVLLAQDTQTVPTHQETSVTSVRPSHCCLTATSSSLNSSVRSWRSLLLCSTVNCFASPTAVNISISSLIRSLLTPLVMNHRPHSTAGLPTPASTGQGRAPKGPYFSFQCRNPKPLTLSDDQDRTTCRTWGINGIS